MSFQCFLRGTQNTVYTTPSTRCWLNVGSTSGVYWEEALTGTPNVNANIFTRIFYVAKSEENEAPSPLIQDIS